MYLNQLSASSLNVLVYMFLETPDWSTELRERHRLLVDILNLAAELGVEFAFPTQTLWLKQPDEGQAARVHEAARPLLGEAEREGVARAATVFEQFYGASPPKPDPVQIDAKPRSKTTPSGGSKG